MLTNAQNEALCNLNFIRKLIVQTVRKNAASPELAGLLAAEAAASEAFTALFEVAK